MDIAAFAWKIMPQVEMDFGALHLVVKILAAALAIGIAVKMAKPGQPKLQLQAPNQV